MIMQAEKHETKSLEGLRDENELIEMKFLRSELMCPICLELLCNPVTLPCGHNFDQECLANVEMVPYSRKSKILCPICRDICIVDSMKVNKLIEVILQTACPLEYNSRKDMVRLPANNTSKIAQKKARFLHDCIHFEPTGFYFALFLLIGICTSIAILSTPVLFFFESTMTSLNDFWKSGVRGFYEFITQCSHIKGDTQNVLDSPLQIIFLIVDIFIR